MISNLFLPRCHRAISDVTDAQGLGSQFLELYYSGRGSWNEETETLLFPSDGSTPVNILKEDASEVKVYYELSKESAFLMPDLAQFDPSTCASHAVQCCWPRDRQANDNNGNCASPYDENCVDKDAGDNTDLCYNELFIDGFSNNSDADGFSVYDDEGPIHCHGFAWSNDYMEASSRYKANALFFVSMYDHMYTRGYVGNIPGSPMCGCVEHVSISFCCIWLVHFVIFHGFAKYAFDSFLPYYRCRLSLVRTALRSTLRRNILSRLTL